MRAVKQVVLFFTVGMTLPITILYRGTGILSPNINITTTAAMGCLKPGQAS